MSAQSEIERVAARQAATDAAQNRWTVLILGNDVGLPEGPIGSGLAAVAAILETGAADDPGVGDNWQAALSAIADGQLDAADRCLARAEDADLIAAQTEFATGAERMARAGLSRRMRARVADARGNLRQAARYYSAAHRCVGARDLQGRARLTLMQAEALGRLAVTTLDKGAMAGAAAALGALAKVADPERIGALWTEAHLRLGGMLGWLGETEASPALLEQAADALRRALETMPAGWPPQGRAAADRGLARIMARLLAPELPAAAVEPAPVIAAPIPKISVATPAADLEAIVARLDPAFVRAPGEAAGDDWIADGTLLAGALSELGRRRSPPEAAQLERAAEVYEAVLAAAAESMTPIAAAELGDALAGVLWAIGLRTGDPARLTFATQTKLAVLDAFEAGAATARAATVRAELEQLAGDLVRLTNAKKRRAKAG